ncbi:MAG TPA: hypothetical protein DDW45_09065 [Gammaproteobacteria bacterium]|nr:hypothetical protein [Gammaproteobacteria bacterium]
MHKFAFNIGALRWYAILVHHCTRTGLYRGSLDCRVVAPLLAMAVKLGMGMNIILTKLFRSYNDIKQQKQKARNCGPLHFPGLELIRSDL